MTFTREEVINFIVQAIESGYSDDLFQQNFIDDGDDIMDYMGTDINQKEFDIWCEKNIPK